MRRERVFLLGYDYPLAYSYRRIRYRADMIESFSKITHKSVIIYTGRHREDRFPFQCICVAFHHFFDLLRKDCKHQDVSCSTYCSN